MKTPRVSCSCVRVSSHTWLYLGHAKCVDVALATLLLFPFHFLFCYPQPSFTAAATAAAAAAELPTLHAK